MDEQPPEPVFIERSQAGQAQRVHVAIPESLREAWWTRMRAQRPIYAELYPAATFTALVFEPVPCMCGYLAHRPSQEDGADGYVEEFADELLCGSCRRAWIAAGRDVGALFEHPQPGVVELDEGELEMEA